MKKYIVVLLMVFILSSCFTSKDSVEKAKQDLGIIELEKSEKVIDDVIVDNNISDIEDDNSEIIQDPIIPEKEKIKKFEIQSLTDEQFLEIDDLSNENIFDGEVEITGTTLSNVDKIVVKFSNETSDFPDDVYSLNKFSKGDSTFLYRAFSRYETLDFGKNKYIFEAYSGDKVTKLELILNVIKEEEKNITEKIDEQFEDISLDTLPVGTNYGNPIDLGNGKISYSDLKGLEIKKDVLSDLTCETLTSVLTNKIGSWFFWNTCRPIEGDEGLSYFVIRLDGDKYIYEKHYYLSYEGIYGIQELETGTGVTSKNIGEKNTELKELNEDYNIIEIVDSLFKEILK